MHLTDFSSTFFNLTNTEYMTNSLTKTGECNMSETKVFMHVYMQESSCLTILLEKVTLQPMTHAPWHVFESVL